MADKKGAAGEKVLYCSFCGKSQHEVRKLIAGPSVFICDECIELCNDIIRDEVGGAEAPRPRPRAATCRRRTRSRDILDQYVIGQDAAKTHPVGRGLQPLQARCGSGGKSQGRCRARQEQHPAHRAHRLGQDAARADPGAAARTCLS
jgi:hypothetical protein